MTTESTNQSATPNICVIDAGMPTAKVMQAFAKYFATEKVSLEGVNLNPFKTTEEELAKGETLEGAFVSARSIGFIALPE